MKDSVSINPMTRVIRAVLACPLLRMNYFVMSRVLIAALSFASLWQMGDSAYAEDDATLNTAQLETLKPIMQGWVDANTLPNAAVLVRHQGETVFSHQVGTLDLETGTPVQEDSLYRIYSMTKPVTAVVAMILVDRGALSLDGPISTVLPEFSNLTVLNGSSRAPANPMTLRHLLSHSAGLTYGYYGDTAVDRMYREAGLIDSWDYLVPTTHDLVVGLGQLPLLFQPGERFHYSFASDVLGEVITRASGQTLDVFLQEELWEPLGIEDAYFDVPESELARFGTNQYPFMDASFPIQDSPRQDPEFRDVTFLSGGGGLVMTIADYGRFAQFLLDGSTLTGERLLSEATLREMVTNQIVLAPQGVEYGLGLGIRHRPDPRDAARTITIYYWGGAAGTSFWIDPTYDLAVVFFTQLIGAPNEPAMAVANAVYGSLARP